MLPGQRIGSLIGAGFGLVYVEINAASLAPVISGVARIAGALLFVAALALLVAGRRPARAAGPPVGHGFGRGYLVVVGVELAAIVVGARLLTGVLGLPHAVVAWISVVVGLHFVVLAILWRSRLFHLLGAAIALCGAAGLAAAGAGLPDAVVAGTGGVVPGFLLLAAGCSGAARTLSASRGASRDERENR